MPKFANREEYEKWKAQQVAAAKEKSTRQTPDPLTTQRKQLSTGKIILGFIIVVCFVGVIAGMVERAGERPAPSVPYELRSSSWDGSVPAVMSYLNKNLKDPDSFQSIEWSPVTKLNKNTYVVRCKYRAKNSFGGYVIDNKAFFMNPQGEVIAAVDYNK